MISCIAIDDEPLALRKLGDYIKRTPFLELESSCTSALEAMRVLSEKEIDLMFIDINMPDLSGMDFVKSLVRKPMIIFTTAYSEFALEGFKTIQLSGLSPCRRQSEVATRVILTSSQPQRGRRNPR